MKKLLSVILALAMFACSGWVALGEMGELEDTPAAAEGLYTPDHLTIGSTTQMSGYFFTDMWGMNTADIDIRTLLHGYPLVAWTEMGNFEVDPSVASEASMTDDAAGNRTYNIRLAEDMLYNDGARITAKDYIFSVLLQASPAFTSLAGAPSPMNHFVGHENFRNGNPFLGVRLISEYEFSLTVSESYLPYFYELIYINIRPYPIHVIAPGCDVADDGRGAYITGPFTKELLESTVMDPDRGYLYMPTVTSGPYTLTGYSRTSHEATFRINPLYKGNFEDAKPTVPNLTVRSVDQETMFEELQNGQLDIINKVTSGKRIHDGIRLAGEGKMLGMSYLRAGLSHIGFACEMGPTSSEYVRKAVALCVDTTQLTQDFLLGFGMPVYGFYGYGQWMAGEMQESLTELAKYELNLLSAAQMLERGGWTLDENGNAYDGTGVRHRLAEDGTLEPLTIRWAMPIEADLSDPLEAMLTPNLKSIGFEVITERMVFSELLRHYYRQIEREFNLFTLSTNFQAVYDPYPTFLSDEEHQGIYNTTGIADDHLAELARDMNRTSAEESETYLEKWMEFQQYWTDVLPMVPLYSNVYYDFVRPDMNEYYANAHVSWATAILYATFGTPEEDEGLELEMDDSLDLGDIDLEDL